MRSVLLRGGELGRAAIDGWGTHAHGRGAVVDVGAGGAAAGVVRGDGEGFVFGIVVRADFSVFFEGHGAARADHAGGDSAGLVAEDVALGVVREITLIVI